MERNLRRIRKAMDISQISLASALGVSNVLIYYWESGKRNPSPEMVQKLSEFLGIEASKIIHPVVSL